jgi:hypothetical protein
MYEIKSRIEPFEELFYKIIQIFIWKKSGTITLDPGPAFL